MPAAGGARRDASRRGLANDRETRHRDPSLLRLGRGDSPRHHLLPTIIWDLTEAIVVGFAFGSVLFIHGMSRITEVATDDAFVGRDGEYPKEQAANPDVVI